MEHRASMTMHRWLHTSLGHFVARMLVLALVIQPLWQLSQTYQWNPDHLHAMFTWAIDLFRPVEAHAATPVPNLARHNSGGYRRISSGVTAPQDESTSRAVSNPWSLKPGLIIMAKTPDGLTPAQESECDGQPGALFGLCNAYCEAMDCDSDSPHASARACQRVLDNFLAKSGGIFPPCINLPPVPTADSATTYEDTDITIDVMANDNAGPPNEDQTLIITQCDHLLSVQG